MKVVGVLLAAGESSRFGGQKLAFPLADGEPLGLRSARHLRSAVEECIAIVRDPDTPFTRELEAMGYSTRIQPHPERGMGSSLALGIGATARADAWVIALADMPWIKPDTIHAVAAGMRAGAELSAPFHDGWRGHPVGIGARFRDELLALEGDKGARAILSKHADLVTRVDVDDPGILHDVDERADLTYPDQ